MNADQPIKNIGFAKMQSEETNNQTQMGVQQALWTMPSLPAFLFPPWNYPPSLPVNYPQFNPLIPPPPPPPPTHPPSQHLLMHSNQTQYNCHQNYYENSLLYASNCSPIKAEFNIKNPDSLSKREEDQAFVDNFVSKLDNKIERKCSMKIYEALDMFCQCMQSISKLKTIRSEMSAFSIEDSYFKKNVDETKMTKNQIEGIFSLFNSSNIRHLKYSVSKRKAKRKRLRILSAATKVKEGANHSKELHRKIDAWQQSFKQELLNAEMEKKLKKEADLILNEVRRKKSDANKFLNLLQTVEKLRNLKMESAFKKSKVVFEDNDDFHKSVSNLQQVLNLRLANYEEEEKTLQVMLTEEHQETRKSVQQQIADDENIKLQLKRKKERLCIFGPNETINEDDPRHPYWFAYTQADRDLDTLVNIRRKWDTFIVPCDTPHSSGIPLRWVLPSEPSSKGWKKYLIE